MTKIRQSKELTAFYNAYNEWLEAGAPEENKYGFSGYDGLCCSIVVYTRTPFSKIAVEMESQFAGAKLSKTYPFTRSNFIDRYDSGTLHLDPNRRRWVKTHLTEEVKKEFTLQK